VIICPTTALDDRLQWWLIVKRATARMTVVNSVSVCSATDMADS